MIQPGSGFLVDTNGLSEFIKPQPNARVKLWFETADPESLFVSVITVGEIRLTIQAKRKGVAVATADGLIAATALEHDLTLITRNVKHFASLGVAILNPWEGS